MWRRKTSIFLPIALLLATGSSLVKAELCSPSNGEYSKVFHIAENSADGTFIGNLDVDGTAPPGSTPNIFLEFDALYLATVNECGSNGKTCESWLRLDPSSQNVTLVLQSGEMLDRDGVAGVKRIDAKVTCNVTSGVNIGRETSIYVIVFVDDVNDNDPVFSRPNMEIFVNELTPVNYVILSLSASDVDEISSISYQIVSTTQPDLFSIPDPSTGDIVLNKKLDYERMKLESTQIAFTVTAIDIGMDGVRSAVAAATVQVTDGDDQLPVFQPCVQLGGSCVSTEYKARLLRNVDPGTIIVGIQPELVSAIDPDIDLQEQTHIIYSLHGNPDDATDYSKHFQIDENTGQLNVTTTPPEFATKDEFSLFIKATQDNDVSKFSMTKLNLKMVSVLEDLHPPEFTHGNLNGFVFTSEEKLAIVRYVNGSLLHLMAIDRDYPSGLTPPLTFNIIDLNSSTPFEITSDGFLLFERFHNPDNSLPFTVQIQTANPEAVSAGTLNSNTISVTVVSEANDGACTSIGCGYDHQGLHAGIAVTASFLGLAIVALIILAFTVIKYKREYSQDAKKSLEGFQNHFANELGGCVASNNSSACSRIDKLKESQIPFHVEQPSSISNNNTNLLNNIRQNKHRIQTGGKSTRYHANGNSGGANQDQMTKEDSPSIAPYDSVSAIDASYEPSRLSSAALKTQVEKFYVQESVSYDQLSIDQEISHSATKSAHRGFLTLQNGHITKCFVKVYSESYPHKCHLSNDVAAMSEVLNLRSCTHINLVKFYGGCINSGSLYAMSEFLTSSTDLRSALRNSRMKNNASVISSFSGSQISNLALAIADGLRYLHGHSIAQGNVCCKEILLTDQMVPKLTGCCGRRSERLRKISLRWAAPEVVTDREYLLASDVWSYAITVWEIATLGGLPFPTISEKAMRHHLESMGRDGATPLPTCRNVARRLWTILQSCWEVEPNSRPTIANVYKKLSKLRETATPIFVSATPGYEFAPTTVWQRRS